jgi:hypothetical protein
LPHGRSAANGKRSCGSFRCVSIIIEKKMNRKLKTIIPLLFLHFILTFSVNGMERTVQNHYFDINQNSLEQYESVWSTLHNYYRDHTPKKIIIEYKESGSSRFDCKRNRIILALNHLNSSPKKTIAHETSHLALFHLTNEASLLERFRFFDEGFANIIGAQATDTQDDYKKIALNIAALQHHKSKVSFLKVQDWSSYFNYPDAPNRYAYHVGASFNYYIIDTYGKQSLNYFFVDIGKTKNLDLTFQNVLDKPSADVETEWMKYLEKIHVDPLLVETSIVSMFPPNKAKKIDIDIKEIYVVFNTDMQKNICIATPCQNSGICYKNAYWKTSKILAIRIKKRLKPDFTFKLSLGYPQKCSLYNAAGIDLPITRWQFTTQ